MFSAGGLQADFGLVGGGAIHMAPSMMEAMGSMGPMLQSLKTRKPLELCVSCLRDVGGFDLRQPSCGDIP